MKNDDGNAMKNTNSGNDWRMMASGNLEGVIDKSEKTKKLIAELACSNDANIYKA